MIQRIIAAIIIVISFGEAVGQFKRLSLKEEELSSRTRGWTNGFSSRISGQTVADTLVANCDQSTIEWASASIKKIQKNQLNYFIAPIKIDLTSRKNKVKFGINGTERFVIPSNNKRDWTLKGEDRSTLEFQYFELDQNNDAIGYLIAGIPGEWLSKGEAVTFSATLDCSGTVGWFKVIQDPNTLSNLRSKAKAESWIDVKLIDEGKSQSMEVIAPPEYSGKMFEYLIGNSIRGRKQAIIREGRAYVKLTIKNSKANTDGMSLELFANEKSLFQFPDIYKKKTVQKQNGNILTEMEGGMYLGKTWKLEVRTLYRPK